MNRELVILLVEDDEGHATLIQKNLRRSGIKNKYLHFKDGQEILDFLFFIGDGPHRNVDQTYMMLLDIRMPRVDGIEVLKKVKEDKELNNIPITMLTTTDNPDEINRCHSLGCNNYITKPVDYEKFIDVLAKLGLFLTIVKVPDA